MQTSSFAVFKGNAYDHTDHQQARHQSMLGSRNIKLQNVNYLCLHTGLDCTCRQCLSFYESSSPRAWRIQQFSRFTVEITNFQSLKGGVLPLRSLLLSKNFIIPIESLNCFLLLGHLPCLEVAVTCGN